MTFNEYIRGFHNLEKFLAKKYGDANQAKIMLEIFSKRIPIAISHKFKTVTKISDMVFGQFIIAERAITTNEKPNEAIAQLALAIIRPKSDTEFDNTDEAKEAKHLKAVMDYNARDIIEVCNDYTELRKEFIEGDFRGVFYKSKDDVDDEDEGEYEEENVVSGFEEQFAKDWYWYSIVDALSKEDVLRHEPIMMLKMSQIAPHLAYMRMKGMIEFKRRKLDEMANKIKSHAR